LADQRIAARATASSGTVSPWTRPSACHSFTATECAPATVPGQYQRSTSAIATRGRIRPPGGHGVGVGAEHEHLAH
jgi:hypothetical protein